MTNERTEETELTKEITEVMIEVTKEITEVMIEVTKEITEVMIEVTEVKDNARGKRTPSLWSRALMVVRVV
jgi:hypothetical protein